MLRRGLALLSIAFAALVAVAAPAQAAVVDVTFGPVSIGDYCHAKVSSSSWIGFYEAGGLRCYTGGPGPMQYAGSGDPYLACKYLTTDVVMAALRGTSDALICRVVR